MKRILTGDVKAAVGFLREAEKLLAFTKQHLNGIKQTRAIGDAIIQAASFGGVDVVWVHASAMGIEVVLANALSLTPYSYPSNTLYLPVSKETDGDVFPAFPGFVLTDFGEVIHKGTKALPSRSGQRFSLLGYLPRYGATLGISGPTIFVFSQEGVVSIGEIAAKSFDLLIPQSSFAMLEYQEKNTWNRLDVPYVWQVPPNNVLGSVHRWQWQPRIWYPDKENLFYAAGMWYGSLAYRTYGPANEIHVQFGCLLEDHYGDHFGYSEIFRKAIGLREPGSGLPPEDVSFCEAWFSLGYYDVDRTSFVMADEWGQRFVHNSSWTSHQAPAFSIDYSSYFGGLADSEDVQLFFWSAPPKKKKTEEETPSTTTYGTLATHNGLCVLHSNREFGSLVSSAFVAEIPGYVAHAISASGKYVAIYAGGKIVTYDIAEQAVVAEKGLVETYSSLAFIPTAHTDPLALPKENTGYAGGLSNVPMQPAIGGVISYWQPSNQGTGTRGWKVVCGDGIHATGYLWGDECWEWTATRVQPTDSHKLDRVHSVVVNGEPYSAGSFFGLAEVLPYYLGMFAGEGALFQEIVLATWDEAGKPVAVAASQGENTKVSVIRRAGISLLYGFGVSSGGPDYYTPSDNAVGPYTWSATNGSLIAVDGGPVTDDTDKVLFIPPEKVCNDSFGAVNVTDSCGRDASRVVELNGPSELRVVVALPYIYASGGIPPYKISTSCGTYDEETGILDYSGCCGSGSATATDSCGRAATKEIKFPVGVWVNSGEQECARLDCSYPPTTAQRQYLYLSDTSRLSMMVAKDCCFIHSDELPQIEPADCAMTWQNVDILDSGEDCTSVFAPYGGVWYSYDGIVRWTWFTKQPQVWACP